MHSNSAGWRGHYADRTPRKPAPRSMTRCFLPCREPFSQLLNSRAMFSSTLRAGWRCSQRNGLGESLNLRGSMQKRSSN